MNYIKLILQFWKWDIFEYPPNRSELPNFKYEVEPPPKEEKYERKFKANVLIHGSGSYKNTIKEGELCEVRHVEINEIEGNQLQSLISVINEDGTEIIIPLVDFKNLFTIE